MPRRERTLLDDVRDAMVAGKDVEFELGQPSGVVLKRRAVPLAVGKGAFIGWCYSNRKPWRFTLHRVRSLKAAKRKPMCADVDTVDNVLLVCELPRGHEDRCCAVIRPACVGWNAWERKP